MFGSATICWWAHPARWRQAVRDRRRHADQQHQLHLRPIAGNIASITSPQGTITYAYDPATGEHVETNTGHTDLAYGYDDQGRLTSVQATRLNGLAVNQTTTYTYDAVGNLKTVTQPDGLTSNYGYDADNRLTDETITNTQGQKVMEFIYALSDSGRRTQEEKLTYYNYQPNGSFEDAQNFIKWTYDADARLTAEQAWVNDPSDYAGAVPPAYTDTFTYDLNANRMQETITPAPTSSDNTSQQTSATINYTYNGDDQRLTQTRTGYQPDVITSSYDANGSLTSSTQTGTDAQIDTYGYDLRNRMISATITPGTADAPGTPAITTFTYDSDGDRASETSGGQTTYYLNDPENPTGYTKAVEETSTLGGVPDRSYVLGLRVEGQSTTTSSGTQDVEYLLMDGHGSTRALVNMSGTITATYDYDAFGNALDFDPDTAATPWLFGGDGLYDPSTGFTYQLARWRDGDVFTSFDSFEADPSSPASLHKYLYANADPIDGNDPSGHFDLVELLTTIGDMATEFGQQVVSVYRAYRAVDTVQKALVWAGAATSALENLVSGPSSVPAFERALIGFTGGYIQGIVSFKSAGWASGIGTAIIDTANLTFSDQKFSWPAFGKIVADVALQASIGGIGDLVFGKTLADAEQHLVNFLLSFDITFSADVVKGIAQPRWLP